MIASGISFPARIPACYTPLDREPEFDSERHLALESPEMVYRLRDFGYSAKACSAHASDVAMTTPFRVLSEQGVAALRDVGEAFKRMQPPTEGDPDAAYIKPRGAAFSSKFVRDLCACLRLSRFLSAIAGTPLAPHTLPTLAASFIYAPPEVEKTNQGWHLDSLGFGLVIMVSDPTVLDGGAFEYFKGTVDEAAVLAGVDDPSRLRTTVGAFPDFPAERIERVACAEAGFGLFMQGNLVLHRGEPLRKRAERCVFVPGFIARDLRFPDATNWPVIRQWSSPTIRQEFARHKAWRVRDKLDHVIDGLPFDGSSESFGEALAEAISELEEARREFRNVDTVVSHRGRREGSRKGTS